MLLENLEKQCILKIRLHHLEILFDVINSSTMITNNPATKTLKPKFFMFKESLKAKLNITNMNRINYEVYFSEFKKELTEEELNEFKKLNEFANRLIEKE